MARGCRGIGMLLYGYSESHLYNLPIIMIKVKSLAVKAVFETISIL
jgi:hypothetical protein